MAELVGHPSGSRHVKSCFRLESLEPDPGNQLHAYRACYTEDSVELLSITFDFPYSRGCLVGHSGMRSLGRVLSQAGKITDARLDVLPIDISQPEKRHYLEASAYLPNDWIEIICWGISRKKIPLIKLHLLFNVAYFRKKNLPQFELPYLWSSALMESEPQDVAKFGESFLKECYASLLSRRRLGCLAPDDPE